MKRWRVYAEVLRRASTLISFPESGCGYLASPSVRHGVRAGASTGSTTRRPLQRTEKSPAESRAEKSVMVGCLQGRHR